MRFETNEKYTLGNMLAEASSKYGDRTYIIFEDKRLSFNDVNDRVNQVANSLAKRGVKKGSHVAILMENCPEFLYTWFGLAKLGAIEAPFNPFHKGDILEYLINYSDAEILVISKTFIDEIRAVERNIKNVKKIIIDGSYEGNPFKRIAVEPYAALLLGSTAPPHVEVRYNDVMSLMFTSGTTGPSKGALISHNQGFFVASQYTNALGADKKDTAYCYIPLFHAAPQFGLVLSAMLNGFSFLLTRSFSAAEFWTDVKKYSCTISGMFEVVVKILLMAAEKKSDVDNPMRAFATAHITPESQQAFEKRFGVKLVNVYGLTEGDCTIMAKHNDSKQGSFGKPRGYFEVNLVDSSDRQVQRGKVGEVVLRPKQSHIMFESYYTMPEKTLEAFRNLWWHTGDLAYQDEYGYFFFVGREKDMIRRGGENISALEVEKIVETHPGVKECAAVAAYSEIWEEEVKIVVVCNENKKIAPAELIDFCDGRMAYFMVPRYIEFVKNIPRTGASGRPVKELLKQITPSTWDRMKEGVKIKREIQKKKRNQ